MAVLLYTHKFKWTIWRLRFDAHWHAHKYKWSIRCFCVGPDRNKIPPLTVLSLRRGFAEERPFPRLINGMVFWRRCLSWIYCGWYGLWCAWHSSLNIVKTCGDMGERPLRALLFPACWRYFCFHLSASSRALAHFSRIFRNSLFWFLFVCLFWYWLC